MRVADIVAVSGGVLKHGDPATVVSSIEYDSRQAQHGSMFVAMRGGYVDGHEFLQQARSAGATVAMVEPGVDSCQVAGYDAVIEVADTRAALAPVSAAFYGQPSLSLTVVGVTGTDGKTTTCHFIDSICRAAGERTGMIGTVEVRIGDEVDLHASRQTTPESLTVQRLLARMRDSGVTVAILEATSHGLAMHRLDHCHFDIGVVTNVTHEHLDFHGTIERYRDAKAGLLRAVDAGRVLGKRGVVAINVNDEGARAISNQAGGARTLRFSLNDGHDVTAANVTLDAAGSLFTLNVAGAERRVGIRLAGRHNVENALAAAAAGHALGYDIDTIARGLEMLQAVPGRMERVDEGQPFTVIVDYAHTPEAIREVLAEARRISGGKVLALFGSAGERDIEKRAIQGAVAARMADFAVFTSEDPRYEDADAIIEAIARGAEEAGARRGVDFECIEDRRAAIARVLEQARAGDIVVLAGKGHERSMIYGNEFRPWHEANVAREALRDIANRAEGSSEQRTAGAL